jgi:hypothetical protein
MLRSSLSRRRHPQIRTIVKSEKKFPTQSSRPLGKTLTRGTDKFLIGREWDLQRFASREIMAAEEDKEAYKEVCSEEAGMG